MVFVVVDDDDKHSSEYKLGIKHGVFLFPKHINYTENGLLHIAFALRLGLIFPVKKDKLCGFVCLIPFT